VKSRRGASLGCFVCALLLLAQPAPAGSLDRLIEKALSDAGFDVSTAVWILNEGDSIQAQRWPGFDRPIPVGSLLKPFAALAYAQTADVTQPRTHCKGDRCWLPSGHGVVEIRQALAKSCNAYFEDLATKTPRSALNVVAGRLGLPSPPVDAPSNATWGLDPAWKLQPPAVIGAYQEIVRRRTEPRFAPIVDGLRMAAETGTAAGVGAGLAKTGTAPCTHTGSNGDGYVLVIHPAESPRYTMLMRLHGRTGREAANAARAALEALLNP